MTWQAHLRAAWGSLPDGTRRALVIMLVVALGLILLSFVLPPDFQIWAVLALFGLFIVAQAFILWQLGRQSPAVRNGRTLYLQGDFPAAVSVLEADRASGKVDVERDTLLGNTYRQLGDLDESETVLRAAYEADPASPFVTYGLGSTLLAAGRYDEAITLITQALDNGGQSTILFDLGHAQYRAGDLQAAAETLKRANELKLEPHRALLTHYLLWRLAGEPEDDDIGARLAPYEAGLFTWQSVVERFNGTPFGAALTIDVMRMGNILSDYFADKW